MQLLPLHQGVGVGWEGGGSNLIFGEAYCTAHCTDTSASVAYTVDWNTDRELRKLSC